MKKVLVFLLILLAMSCDVFNAKKVDSETIYKEQLETFNWNTVYAYPTFSACDTMETNQEKKTCFETLLSEHITKSLQSEGVIVYQDIEDTVMLDFLISETGVISIKNINASNVTIAQIPELDSIIIRSLETLPQIFPAIKRDQPVKTAFKLPIIIAVN